MRFDKIEFTAAYGTSSQLPPPKEKEMVFSGRSNVGKSSFVNKLLNRKSLARTSSKPGKTATLNFYNIDNCFYFVDLPGYGYAEVSKFEREKWAKMINLYLTSRPQLCSTFLIVDFRHKPTADDLAMFNWIKQRHGFAVVIATKVDKVKKSKYDENLKIIINTLPFSEDDILLPFSAEKDTGIEDVWKLICERTETSL